jgi:DNA polymerase-3 subunit alpha
MKYFCNTRLEAFKSLEQLVGKNLSFGGIVNNVQHRVAKNGKGWATFQVDGYDESFEFRIFDEEYLKFRHFLVQNNFAYFRVMIKEGWVNKETGKKSDPKIVFTHVQYLQDVLVDFAKKLTIQMPIEDLKEQLIQRLNELFQGHQGNLNVTFEVLELEKVTRQIERKMEIEEEFISDEEEGSETLVMESQMEEVEELIIKNKLEMPSRKLKVGISKELLEELEKMQLKFKLN